MDTAKIVAEIESRLGFFPPFFEAALDRPIILANLWHQTCTAYLDSPLPALFKEKLAVLLARYCPVPYCLVCHSYSLLPLGLTAPEVLKVVDINPASPEELFRVTRELAGQSWAGWPEPGSPREEVVFQISLAIFLHQDTCGAQAALRAVLQPEHYDYLTLFIAYNATCLTWAEAHPELSWKRDGRCLSDGILAGRVLEAREASKEPSLRYDLLWQQHIGLLAKERALRERYRIILESIGDAVIATTAEESPRVVFLNPVAEQLTGWTLDEARHRPISEVFVILNQFTRKPVENPVLRVIELGVTVGLANHTVLIARDGREFVIEDSAAPVRDPDGRAEGVVLVFRDATERAVLTDRLQREEQYFRNLAEMTPQMLFSSDASGAIDYFNQKFYEYSGIPPERLIDWNWKETPLHHPDDLQATLERWNRSLSTGEPYEVEYRLRRHDGVYRWFLGRALPVRDDNGAIVRWLGTNTDIHDLLELRGRLSEAVRAAALGFWEWDIRRGEVLWSEELRQQYGFPEGQLAGSLEEVLNRIEPDDRVRVVEALTRARDHKQAYSIEFRVIPAPGQVRWLACQGSVRFNAEQETIYMTGTALDITDRITAAEELRAAMEAAEVASRTKSSFLANMSHELRTPLGAVLGFTELLRTPDLDRESLDEFLSIIERNAEQVARIIDDILDLSKVEAGRLVLEQVPFSTSEFLEELRALFQTNAGKKNLRFEVEQSGTLPPTLIGDPTRLRQVLLNLVSNAIKFTAQGSVLLRAGYVDGFLHFEVQDSGIGMSAEQQSGLFEAFRQADSSTTRKFGGTGLGLALSRQLCQLMGGWLELASSEPEKGSLFRGAAALSSGELQPADAQPATFDFSGLQVLLAEDSPDLQTLVQLALSQAGAEVLVVPDGEAAFAAATQKNYDVVLLDLQMPKLDGLATVQKLRAAAYQGPVLAFTANLMQDERDRCLKAGFSGFLGKPIKLQLLLETVAATVGRLPQG